MDVTKAIDELKNDTEREVARKLLLDGMEIQEVANQHDLSVDIQDVHCHHLEQAKQFGMRHVHFS